MTVRKAVHGQYLLIIDQDRLETPTYLEPMADAVDLKFTARGFMEGRIGDRLWTERLLFEPAGRRRRESRTYQPDGDGFCNDSSCSQRS